MNPIQVKIVAIIGSGVMGTNMAWACASHGLETRLYDASKQQLDKALERLKAWFYDGRLTAEQADLAMKCLGPCQTMEEAVRSADLAFENVPEDLELKQGIHREIGRLLSQHALQGSNSSSITCSPLAQASGRPDRFINMNFSDPHTELLAELMGNPKTSPETLAAAKAWARSIGMVPIEVKKEIMGYVFNRIWRAIKKESLFLVDQGYSTPEDVDRSFMLCFGTGEGPFGIMDMVGLETVRKIEQRYFEASGDPSDRPPGILNEMVEKGYLGEHVGRGFYRYPDPSYKKPGWLKMEPPWRSDEE